MEPLGDGLMVLHLVTVIGDKGNRMSEGAKLKSLLPLMQLGPAGQWEIGTTGQLEMLSFLAFAKM